MKWSADTCTPIRSKQDVGFACGQLSLCKLCLFRVIWQPTVPLANHTKGSLRCEQAGVWLWCLMYSSIGASCYVPFVLIQCVFARHEHQFSNVGCCRWEIGYLCMHSILWRINLTELTCLYPNQFEAINIICFIGMCKDQHTMPTRIMTCVLLILRYAIQLGMQGMIVAICCGQILLVTLLTWHSALWGGPVSLFACVYLSRCPNNNVCNFSHGQSLNDVILMYFWICKVKSRCMSLWTATSCQLCTTIGFARKRQWNMLNMLTYGSYACFQNFDVVDLWFCCFMSLFGYSML